jgi:hypothetical protein
MNLWTRLGISVALLGMFCILCSELMLSDGFYDTNRTRIAAAMAVLGIVLFFFGRAANQRQAQRLKDEIARLPPEEQEALQAEGGTFILANLAFWGSMLVAFALVVLFIPARVSSAPKVEARAPAPVKKKAEPPLLTNAPPVPSALKTNAFVFPSFKLQGITQRGPQSSALINGQTYFVGENIGPVKLVSIFPNSIVVEANGAMRSINLGH